MRTPEDIIRKPFITEKSNEQLANGRYTFIVDPKATKTEIRIAVEKLFNVKVLNVNTINYKGKQKRMGVHQGYRANWKKAIVQIQTEEYVDKKKEQYERNGKKYEPGSYLEKGGKKVVPAKKYKTTIDEFGMSQ